MFSDQEILNRWEDEEKRHADTQAQIVLDAAKGRGIREISRLLNLSQGSVQEYLDRAALLEAGGYSFHPKGVTAVAVTSDRGPANRNDVRKIMNEYKPSFPNPSYVDEYKDREYDDAVAKRLALAYEATEEAITDGVIEETIVQKAGKAESAVRINLPDGVDWEMRLRRAMTDVKAAARLLNDAKMTDLRRAATRKRVAAAHAKWLEQIERVANLHPTFYETVEECDEA